MKFDLSVIPSTYDSVHAALAATVAGLFFLQILFLILVFLAYRKKCAPAPIPNQPTASPEVGSPSPVVSAPAPAPAEANPDAALQLLSLLQGEARFVDFIKENVTGYSDAEIGAAARVVHDGCAKVLNQFFKLDEIRSEAEGGRVTVPAGFDPASVRLTGNIVGSAPFNGVLIHRGWRVTEVKLPKVNPGHDSKVIAAAEVEL